jgi:hypothetical protein
MNESKAATLKKQGTNKYRLFTSPLRTLPDFIVVGAQRCGTSSLFRYLKRHPNISPSIIKEIQFFSINYRKGILWYRSFFPSLFQKYYFQLILDKKLICGEATPFYIIHPWAIKLIADTLPKVKLLLLLRNPVDRAYSHYHHSVRRGCETLKFEDAIAREKERISTEYEKMLKKESNVSSSFGVYSYLTRGKYFDQVQRLFKYIPRSRVSILRSEDFFQDPEEILQNVFSFLNVKPYKLPRYKIYGNHGYEKMNPETRQNLIEYFRPFNQRLYEYLGVDFHWDN